MKSETTLPLLIESLSIAELKIENVFTEEELTYYEIMFRKDRELLPLSEYYWRRLDLKAELRYSIMRYCSDLTRYYEVHPEVLFRCKGFLDRYVSTGVLISERYTKLMVVVAFFIAM